jgi:hypothetical protein
MKPENDTIIGKKFGDLLVTESIPVQSKSDKRFRTHYKCLCDCGEMRITTKSHLEKGEMKSCGCRRKRNINSRSYTWKGYGELPQKYFGNLKHHAIVLRNIPFHLTIEECWELFLKQDRKCALSGEPLFFKTVDKISNGTASLDRIDSSKGYTIDNVQWVHKELNWMKHKLSQSSFLDWIKKIYLYQKLQTTNQSVQTEQYN